MDEKPVRAFLAIDLPVEILDEIGSIQSELKKTLQGVVRWVRPEAIHLTLKFFGNLSTDEIMSVSRTVGDHASGTKPFALDVEKLGVFPDINRPRVLWIGIGGDVDPLIRFQKSMEQKLHEKGFAKEDRPFRPHLTLARIKEPKGLIGLAKIIEKKDNCVAGHFNAAGLALFRSQLTPKGAIYTKLAQFPFSG
jgi:2'-5' RNA ligase